MEGKKKIPSRNSSPLTDSTVNGVLVVAVVVVLDPLPVGVGVAADRLGVVVQTRANLAIANQARRDRQAQLEQAARHANIQNVARVGHIGHALGSVDHLFISDTPLGTVLQTRGGWSFDLVANGTMLFALKFKKHGGKNKRELTSM